jgi:hypothetical protein
VEVADGATAGTISWKKAKDVKAREKAIDDLVAPWSPFYSQAIGDLDQQHPRDTLGPTGSLARGSYSPEHRRVVEFAAGEYENLANSLGDGSEDQQNQERLLRKAELLRKRAAE